MLTPYLTVVLNIPRRKWVNYVARLTNVYLPMDRSGCVWCKCWCRPSPPVEYTCNMVAATLLFVRIQVGARLLESSTLSAFRRSRVITVHSLGHDIAREPTPYM